MPNSKTSKASYVSKARRVTLKKYKILNGDKTQEKTQNSGKKLKTQAKNSRIRHFCVPYMPKKWPKNKPDLKGIVLQSCSSIPPLYLFLAIYQFYCNVKSVTSEPKCEKLQAENAYFPDILFAVFVLKSAMY